jgi:hypothetical protein
MLPVLVIVDLDTASHLSDRIRRKRLAGPERRSVSRGPVGRTGHLAA